MIVVAWLAVMKLMDDNLMLSVVLSSTSLRSVQRKCLNNFRVLFGALLEFVQRQFVVMVLFEQKERENNLFCCLHNFEGSFPESDVLTLSSCSKMRSTRDFGSSSSSS